VNSKSRFKSSRNDSASGALGDLKLDLNLLADRVARAEFSTQQAQASIERQPVEELVQRSMQNELAKLKAELLDELANSRPAENFTYVDEEKLQGKIDELRGEIRRSANSGKELTELAGRYFAARANHATSRGGSKSGNQCAQDAARLAGQLSHRRMNRRLNESKLRSVNKSRRCKSNCSGALGAVERRDGEVRRAHSATHRA
jgi:hypothetical protein